MRSLWLILALAAAAGFRSAAAKTAPAECRDKARVTWRLDLGRRVLTRVSARVGGPEACAPETRDPREPNAVLEVIDGVGAVLFRKMIRLPDESRPTVSATIPSELLGSPGGIAPLARIARKKDARILASGKP